MEKIEREIRRLEPCHHHYVGNVERLLRMIGAGKAWRILDCGGAADARVREARTYARALRRYEDRGEPPGDSDAATRRVFEALGDATPAKLRLANLLRRRLEDPAFEVYPPAEEDFGTVESRIQHLTPCHHHWRENLGIVLEEIGAGRLLREWHEPDGFLSHGDPPDRRGGLDALVGAARTWLAGGDAGEWSEVLGAASETKRALVERLLARIEKQRA